MMIITDYTLFSFYSDNYLNKFNIFSLKYYLMHNYYKTII